MNCQRRIAVALLLALAACHAQKPNDQRSAAGEVLSGSVSDDMLAYDQLKSQPPLAPRDPSAGAGAAGNARAGTTAAADSAASSAAIPAPVAAPGFSDAPAPPQN